MTTEVAYYGLEEIQVISSEDVRSRVEIVLRSAEDHLTAAEFEDLKANLANGRVDMRIYEDGIVLMRQYREPS